MYTLGNAQTGNALPDCVLRTYGNYRERKICKYIKKLGFSHVNGILFKCPEPYYAYYGKVGK